MKRHPALPIVLALFLVFILGFGWYWRYRMHPGHDGEDEEDAEQETLSISPKQLRKERIPDQLSPRTPTRIERPHNDGVRTASARVTIGRRPSEYEAVTSGAKVILKKRE